jgi:hypothetical protein
VCSLCNLRDRIDPIFFLLVQAIVIVGAGIEGVAFATHLMRAAIAASSECHALYCRTCENEEWGGMLRWWSHAGRGAPCLDMRRTERCAIFFLLRLVNTVRSHVMSNDMDKMCTLVAVAGVIVLLYMGYTELNRLKMTSCTADRDVCGMRGTIPSTAASAKRTSAKKQELTTEIKEQGTYLEIDAQWPNQEANEESVHKEYAQDEDSLQRQYSWNADADVNEKFDKLKINPEAIRKTANTKAVSPDTVIEEPTYSKNLGMSNPVLSIWHKGCSAEKQVQFGSSCTWFGGTDAYYGARQRTNACDCLRDESCATDCAKPAANA